MGTDTPLAVITGASSGIGATYAYRLAERGYDLILIARRTDRLEALAGTLLDRHGTRVETITADFYQEGDLARVEEILGKRRDISMLVNNAGLARLSPFASQAEQDIDCMLSLNVVAFTRVARAVIPGLVARGDGIVINIASALAVGEMPGVAVYVATKAYVLALSLVLRGELSGSGIKVQCVLPSVTATEIWDDMGMSLSDIPAHLVMAVDTLVDAALRGLDQGETVTMPSVEDPALWTAFEDARKALFDGSTSGAAATRYLGPPS